MAADRGEIGTGLNGRVSALSPTEMMRLDLWASTFVDAFDHGPWLVGSVLQRRDFRDVDVRLVLDDDDALLAEPDRLRLLNVGLSVWAQQMTGLPVDFQFQSSSEWVKHSDEGHRRNPLGHRWRTVQASQSGSTEGASDGR